jgi:hypothetical protein
MSGWRISKGFKSLHINYAISFNSKLVLKEIRKSSLKGWIKEKLSV